MLYACFCTTSVPACHILPKPCHLVSQNLAQPLHLYVVRCAAMTVWFNWMGDLVPFGTSVKALWAAESHRYVYIFDSMLYACFCTTSVPECHILPKPCHLELHSCLINAITA